MRAGPAANPHEPGTTAKPAGEVVPRWEWRVFVRGALNVARLASFLKDDTERIRAETYVISTKSLHSIKIHSLVAEVKHLERVAADGLQLWRPMLREEFPLSARVLGQLFLAWGLDEPPPFRPCWSERQLEHDIIAPRIALRSVPVLKQRTPLEVVRCRGEHVGLTVFGEHWESIAFEDPDAGRVRAAAEAVGLSMMPNQSYPSVLARIAGVEEPEQEHAAGH
jgi:hypothetical protein